MDALRAVTLFYPLKIYIYRDNSDQLNVLQLTEASRKINLLLSNFIYCLNGK